MKEPDVLNEFLGTAKLCENDPEYFSVDYIKSLGYIDEDSIEIQMLLNAFLLDLSQ